MTRPTRIEIDTQALLHNVKEVRRLVPNKKIIAMVKADAYGCGVSYVAPALSPVVDAFGVACLEEARILRQFTDKPCILFQGIFSPDELKLLADNQYEVVVHNHTQLQWILANPQQNPLRIWVKVDTGMHRLGFAPAEVHAVIDMLKSCRCVDDDIGLMTHFACADETDSPYNQAQLKAFKALDLPKDAKLTKSLGNSAAILSIPEALEDVVRPGIMLYGVSPFANATGQSLSLKPVMHLLSEITAIHEFQPGARVGYGATWEAKRPSKIGVVAVGYGDGYPRHIQENTPVYIEGQIAPIVGRVSMDTLTVDLTDCVDVKLGTRVELWGEHLPIERIALSSGTIGYELMTQMSPRVRDKAIKL